MTSDGVLTSFVPFPALTTARLDLRCPGAADADAIYHLQTDPVVTRHLGRPTPSRAETDAKLAAIEQGIRDHSSITWALTLRPSGARDDSASEQAASAELIGTCGFWRWDKAHAHAEVGYTLRAEYWGKGLMSEALAAIVRFGFTALGLHRIEANVDPDNAGSLRALEKVGFAREGYLRENWRNGERFSDTVTFGLLERDLASAAPPRAPTRGG